MRDLSNGIRASLMELLGSFWMFLKLKHSAGNQRLNFEMELLPRISGIWALFRSNLDFILSAKETVQSLEFVAQCLLYLPYLRCMPRRPLKTQRLSTPRIKENPNRRSSTGALARRVPIIVCESYITILREVSHQLVMS